MDTEFLEEGGLHIGTSSSDTPWRALSNLLSKQQFLFIRRYSIGT